MDLRSSEPFWLIKNGMIDSYPSLKKDETCDVLIVGSGITGSLIAHQCIADGFDTILIDKREICHGSTSSTTSMLQYEIDTPLYKLIDMIGETGAIESYKACSRAIDQLEVLSAKIKSEAGYERKKSMYYTSRKKDLGWLQQEFDTRKKAGFKVKWLEPEAIEKQFELKATFGGILSAQGASIDAFRFAHELLTYNTKKGLRVYDKTKLETVKYGRLANQCITTGGQTLKAKKVIYCIGYESAQMIKEDFVQLKSTYAMVTEIGNGRFQKLSKALVWNTDDPYLYMRTTDDGRLLIGGGDEDFKDPAKRDALLHKKEQFLKKALLKVRPDIEFYTDFVWAGTFGETKDGLPYIGSHPGFKNSYFVLGFGGNGITFSVTGMEMVSDWLKGKQHVLGEFFRFGR